MDKIEQTPALEPELESQVQVADSVFRREFGRKAWFGRCIFLSWYCERGTCDFCFRSTQKHRIRHPEDARRSRASILAEAAMIRAFGWKLEFLTGGYGIFPFEEIVSIAADCARILDSRVWVNLGALEKEQLVLLKPHVEGIVCSLETLAPSLHKKVCPDKPVEPYLEMAHRAKEMGFKLSFTLVLGIGETRGDLRYVLDLIKDCGFHRVTVYALRPVSGTPYTKGPSTEDMVWWISQLRIAYPKLVIIAGTARYRIPEISLLLRSGANAITKLPATRMFNSSDALLVHKQVQIAGREFESALVHDDLDSISWDSIVGDIPERKVVLETLASYMLRMQRKSLNIKADG